MSGYAALGYLFAVLLFCAAVFRFGTTAKEVARREGSATTRLVAIAILDGPLLIGLVGYALVVGLFGLKHTGSVGGVVLLGPQLLSHWFGGRMAALNPIAMEIHLERDRGILASYRRKELTISRRYNSYRATDLTVKGNP